MNNKNCGCKKSKPCGCEQPEICGCKTKHDLLCSFYSGAPLIPSGIDKAKAVNPKINNG